MSGIAYAFFDTDIGRCAIAWGDGGIKGLRLPDDDPAYALRRLLNRFPDAEEVAPPPRIQAVIDDIVRLMRGEKVDLSAAPLDMSDVPEFHRRIYAVAMRIQPGQIRTYGDIARDLGDITLSRAVGQAMGANPFPIVMPCHRVMAAGGKLGGFSAPGGSNTKLKMLVIEGGKPDAGPQGDLFG
ncbi:methylated-DNA--[protein]-cysteine S-methyltransferase [Caulobacter segnis]|uniref:methylated-DNA--[protein]-cysteine S-methyltransferase n=1 Tax=Caulobacter segnis TaxID=88688 RepID=UPI002410029B|nr:methylated-DNA--[protein]-cysteine S-methyltransferase [Caulobacter segnis]MDG2520987.1 methylated-DNA--[protein]-cysteine S-methyltransferase [Caulobacter segnis]